MNQAIKIEVKSPKFLSQQIRKLYYKSLVTAKRYKSKLEGLLCYFAELMAYNKQNKHFSEGYVPPVFVAYYAINHEKQLLSDP